QSSDKVFAGRRAASAVGQPPQPATGWFRLGRLDRETVDRDHVAVATGEDADQSGRQRRVIPRSNLDAVYRHAQSAANRADGDVVRAGAGFDGIGLLPRQEVNPM